MSFIRPSTHPHLTPALNEEKKGLKTREVLSCCLSPCNFPPAPSADKAANKGELLQRPVPALQSKAKKAGFGAQK